MTGYHFSTPFEMSLGAARTAGLAPLERHGFGVLTEIDVEAMRTKFADGGFETPSERDNLAHHTHYRHLTTPEQLRPRS